jgi:putative ABC transport system permease protein
VRSFDALPVRQLRSRRLRALLTTAGIVLGVGMILGVLLLSATIQRTFSDLFDSVYGRTDLVVSGSQSSGSVPPDTLDRVAAIEGVEDTSANIFSPVTLIEDSGQAGEDIGSQLNVLGTDPHGREFTDAQIVEGRGIRSGLSEITLQQSWADARGVGVGDEVQLAFPAGVATLPVVGLFDFATGLDFGGEGFAAMPIAPARELMDKPDVFDEVLVVVSGGERSIAEVRGRIRAELGRGVDIKTPDGKSGEIESQIQGLNAILYFFAAMALFVGGFLIFNAFHMTVLQRMREIGMLRTLGATRRMIVRSVLIEALLLGTVGAVIGLGLGVLLAKGLILLMRGIGFPVGGLVFTPIAPIAAVATGLITAVLGALHPARRAGRVSPIQAVLGSEGIRTRPGLGRAVLGAALIVPGLGGAFLLGAADETTPLVAAAGMVGTVAVFFGIALLTPFVVSPMVRVLSWPVRRSAPVEGRLAADSAASHPGRTAATATGLTIGLALVVAFGSLGSSFLNSISDEFDRSFARDLTVQPRGFSPGQGPQQTIAAGLRDRILALPEAEVVAQERFLFQPGLPRRRTRGSTDGLLIAFDPADYREVDNTEIEGASREQAFDGLARGGVTVGKGYADEENLEVGDVLTLDGPSEIRRARIAGIVKTVIFGGQTVGMSLDVMREVWGVTADSELALKATSDDARDDLQRKVAKIVGRDYPNLAVLSNDQLKDDIQGQINQQFGVFNAIVGVAIVVSLFGVINTLSMSVFERTREIGVLRALGTSRWQVRRLIGNESLIISLIGALLGIVVGAGLGWALLKGLAAGVPGVSYRAPLGTMAGVAVAGVVLGLIAAVLPARRAARLNVIQAVSYE